MNVHPVSFGDRMTLEEWAALDEDEPGEIVDGVLVEDEVPSMVHERVVVWISRRRYGSHYARSSAR